MILFPYTNKIVEYEAVINGMIIAIELKVDEFHIYGDSQVVINKVNDVYQTKDDKLLPYKRMRDDLKSKSPMLLFNRF